MLFKPYFQRPERAANHSIAKFRQFSSVSVFSYKKSPNFTPIFRSPHSNLWQEKKAGCGTTTEKRKSPRTSDSLHYFFPASLTTRYFHLFFPRYPS